MVEDLEGIRRNEVSFFIGRVSSFKQALSHFSLTTPSLQSRAHNPRLIPFPSVSFCSYFVHWKFMFFLRKFFTEKGNVSLLTKHLCLFSFSVLPSVWSLLILLSLIFRKKNYENFSFALHITKFFGINKHISGQWKIFDYISLNI